jgi:hypothetical protein
VEHTSLPALFQHQLEQHAQVQMQQMQQRQQQCAQRQQQPISRPGPALASIFDALSYTDRDGLNLLTLEPPQMLGMHAAVANSLGSTHGDAAVAKEIQSFRRSTVS